MQKYFFNLLATFTLPFLAFYSPLQHSLIALGIFILINYILAVIAQFREGDGNYIIRLILSIFNKSSFVTTGKVILDYFIAIVFVGLFEVYFMDVDVSEISTKFLSLTHLVLIYVGYKELKRGFEINAKITGTNFYTEIEGFIPQKFKNFFSNNKPLS